MLRHAHAGSRADLGQGSLLVRELAAHAAGRLAGLKAGTGDRVQQRWSYSTAEREGLREWAQGTQSGCLMGLGLGSVDDVLGMRSSP